MDGGNMDNKKNNIDALLKPLTDYDGDDSYLLLLRKITQFRDTLDDKQRKEFRELFFLVKDYISYLERQNYIIGFSDGLFRAEIKQRRQMQTK